MNLYQNDLRNWQIKSSLYIGDVVLVTDQHQHYTKSFSVPLILAAEIDGEFLLAVSRDRNVWKIHIRSGTRQKIAYLPSQLINPEAAKALLKNLVASASRQPNLHAIDTALFATTPAPSNNETPTHNETPAHDETPTYDEHPAHTTADVFPVASSKPAAKAFKAKSRLNHPERLTEKGKPLDTLPGLFTKVLAPVKRLPQSGILAPSRASSPASPKHVVPPLQSVLRQSASIRAESGLTPAWITPKNSSLQTTLAKIKQALPIQGEEIGENLTENVSVRFNHLSRKHSPKLPKEQRSQAVSIESVMSPMPASGSLPHLATLNSSSDGFSGRAQFPLINATLPDSSIAAGYTAYAHTAPETTDTTPTGDMPETLTSDLAHTAYPDQNLSLSATPQWGDTPLWVDSYEIEQKISDPVSLDTVVQAPNSSARANTSPHQTRAIPQSELTPNISGFASYPASIGSLPSDAVESPSVNPTTVGQLLAHQIGQTPDAAGSVEPKSQIEIAKLISKLHTQDWQRMARSLSDKISRINTAPVKAAPYRSAARQLHH